MHSLALLGLLAVVGLSLTTAHHDCAHHKEHKHSKEHHHDKSHHHKHGKHHKHHEDMPELRHFADNLIDYSVMEQPAWSMDLNGRNCPQNASAYPQFSGEAPSFSDTTYWSDRVAMSVSLSTPELGGFAAFDTIAVSANKTDEKLDVVATRLVAAPVGPPAIGLAYFDEQSKYTFNYEVSVKDLAKLFDAGEYSSASVVMFTKIIEFEDVDGDGEYNIETDVLVSEQMLSRQEWDTICESPDDESMKGLKVYNATTMASDNSTTVFSLQTVATNVTGELDSWILTPRQVKWALEISDYPFTTNETQMTRLAVETYVLTASSNMSANWNVSWSDALISSGITSIIGTNNDNRDADIYVNWKSTAQISNMTMDGNQTKTETSAVDVKASWFVPSEVPSEVTASLFFGASGDANVTARVVYYSFDAIKPSRVRFDQATLGAGKDANEASNAFSSRTVAIAVGVIVLLAGIGGISYFGYRYYTERKRRESALLDDDQGYQRLPSQA